MSWTARQYIMGRAVQVGWLLLLLLWLDRYLADNGVHWHKDTQFNDKIPSVYNASWERTPMPSLRACARTCAQQNSCQGFFYVKEQTCKTSSIRYLIHGDELDAPGYRYFRKFSADSCPPGSVLYEPTMTCYAVFSATSTIWTAARDSCRGQGGRLAVLDTSSKLDFFLNYYNNENTLSGVYHVGGLRPYVEWNTPYPDGVVKHAWLTGAPLDWTLYKSAGYTESIEPSGEVFQNSVAVYRFNLSMGLQIGDCDSLYPGGYVCEFSVI